MYEYLSNNNIEYKYRSYELNGLWHIERQALYPAAQFIQGTPFQWVYYSVAKTKADADAIVKQAMTPIKYHYY